MNILLVDVSTYQVSLPEPYRQILSLRLKGQAEIQQQRLGFQPSRPSKVYARGLLIIAASLKREGHTVAHVVYNDKEDRKRLPGLFAEADVLGVSAVTPSIDLAAQISSLAKSLNPSIVCVVGGPHINALPEETLQRFPQFDIAAPGPGEVIFPLLLSKLHDLANVPSVVFRDHNGEIQPTARKLFLGDVPYIMPAYEVLYRPLSEYAHNIRTQSGCPYGCHFCVERHSWIGSKVLDSVDRAIEELIYLSHSCKPGTLVHFADAIFNLNKRRTLEFCQKLRQFQGTFIFSIDTRVDLLDPEVIKAMSTAGIVYFRFGFENAEDTVLEFVNKGSTFAQGQHAVHLLREIAPSSVIHAYWLTGLPGMSRENIVKNASVIYDLVTKDVVDVIGNKVFVPYPGTPYYSEPEMHGIRLVTKIWKHYDRLSLPVYSLSNLSETEIYSAFQMLEATVNRAYTDRLGKSPLLNHLELEYMYSCYIDPYVNYTGYNMNLD